MTVPHITNDLFLLMYYFNIERRGGDKCELKPSLRGTAAIHHALVLRVRRPELYKVSAVGASL